MTTKGRRRQLMLLALGMGVGLAGCGVLAPRGPRTLDVSEAKLETMLERRFPYHQRYMDMVEVVLSSPRLRLMPDSQRLGTQLQYTLGGPLLGARELTGAVDLSYGLRYEPSDGSVRLTQVRVESLRAPGVPAAFQSNLSQLAENLLQDAPIHRFKPEELQAARDWGYQPGALRVLPGALQLQLEPLARH